MKHLFSATVSLTFVFCIAGTQLVRAQTHEESYDSLIGEIDQAIADVVAAFERLPPSGETDALPPPAPADSATNGPAPADPENEALQVFDRDKDGKLTEAEGRLAIEVLGTRIMRAKLGLNADPRVAKIVKAFDANGDNRLSQSELAAVFKMLAARFGP